MKISELKECPEWLNNARTKNADVEINNGIIVWRDGEWNGGEWRDGEWRGGLWLGGVWRGGVWRGGVWNGGEWNGGEWRDGLWNGGEWRDGLWLGGLWLGGVWKGKENRLFFMASSAGIHFEDGVATAYRTTKGDFHGRHNPDFLQIEGEYFDTDLPPAGTGTCVKGIHVTSAARAWTYFGIDPTCQFWKVVFKREDLLDCDGEKARIRGGTFTKIDRPF